MNSHWLKRTLLAGGVMVLAVGSGLFLVNRSAEAQPPPPVAEKVVLGVTFDDAQGYPSMGGPIGPAIDVNVGLPQTQVSVTSWDGLMYLDPYPIPLDSIVVFYVDVPQGCWARWWDPQNAFPLDRHTNLGHPIYEPYSPQQLGTEDPTWQMVKRPGDIDMPGAPIPPPGQTFEISLWYQTSWYGLVEMLGNPLPMTRFFDFHCDEPSEHIFWVCNKIEPLPPYSDPNFPQWGGPWPGNNVMCAPLTVNVWGDADLSLSGVGLDPAPPYTLRPGIPKTATLSESVNNAGPYGPVNALVTKRLDVPAGCWGDIDGTSGTGPTTITVQTTVGPIAAGGSVADSEQVKVACYNQGAYQFVLHKDVDPTQDEPHIRDAGQDEVTVPIDVIIEKSAEMPTFSIRRGGPDAAPLGPYHPADILGLGAPGGPPVVVIPCGVLGLFGCQMVGAQDDIDGMSWGADWISAWEDFRFSASAGSTGAAGSACMAESSKLPPEQMGDEFQAMPQLRLTVPGGVTRTNVQALDENGNTAYPFGLQIGTNVDGLDDHMPLAQLYFSLAPGSPSLAMTGASPADILVTRMGGPISLYAPAAMLGLNPAADDIDGICLLEDGVGGFSLPVGNELVPGDRLYFTLAPGSATLAALGAGPADVLKPQSCTMPPCPLPKVAYTADKFGMLGGDNVTAMKCIRPPLPTAGVCPDLNGDGKVSMADVTELARAWGTRPWHYTYDTALDLNLDTKVTMADQTVLARKWGVVCSVPTP